MVKGIYYTGIIFPYSRPTTSKIIREMISSRILPSAKLEQLEVHEPALQLQMHRVAVALAFKDIACHEM